MKKIRSDGMYCEECRVLFEGARCPVCGSRRIRAPEPDDLCLLTEKEQLWSDVLRDVLTQHEIPFLTEGVMGAGLALRVGPMLERVRFYVPYSHLERAGEIAAELFGEEQKQ